tara:strand:- start:17368 stop:17802 length:435 start_codon:yes stop_codon:yes gene_type:complete
MYIGIKHLHSVFAYLVLIALIVVIGYSLFKLVKKGTFTEKVRKSALVVFICSHLQLLIGLILYTISPVGISSFSTDAMGDSMLRLTTLEHPLLMIAAIAIITIGYIKAKKPGDDARRLRTIVVYYSIALVLMLFVIPWSVWLPF